MLLMSNSSFFLDEDQRNNPDWQSRVSQSLFLIFIFTSEKRQVASQRQSSTNAKVWLSLKIRRYVMDPISGVNNTIPDKAGILYTYMARNSKTVMFKVILSPIHTFLISFHFLKWPSFSVPHIVSFAALRRLYLTKIHAFCLLPQCAWNFLIIWLMWLGQEEFLEWANSTCPPPSKAPQSKLQVCNVIPNIKWKKIIPRCKTCLNNREKSSPITKAIKNSMRKKHFQPVSCVNTQTAQQKNKHNLAMHYL